MADSREPRSEREQPATADQQQPGTINMDPAAATRSDGWVTDTTPNAEPQHVIDRNASESAAALQPRPGQGTTIDTTLAPERPLAPGAMESSAEHMVERAEDQEEARRKAAAHQPRPQQRR